MAWVSVGPESDIPVEDMKCFTIEGEAIAVYHLEDGWYATSDICTHQDCSLTEGDIEDNEVICWCHGGAFDIRTGTATRMPCVIPVDTYLVRIRDGLVEVDFE